MPVMFNDAGDGMDVVDLDMNLNTQCIIHNDVWIRVRVDFSYKLWFPMYMGQIC